MTYKVINYISYRRFKFSEMQDLLMSFFYAVVRVPKTPKFLYIEKLSLNNTWMDQFIIKIAIFNPRSTEGNFVKKVVYEWTYNETSKKQKISNKTKKNKNPFI